MRAAGELYVDKAGMADIAKDLKCEIDCFIERNMGTVFHETAFNNISAKTFCTEPGYYLAHRKGKLVGVFPYHEVRRKLLLSIYSNLTTRDLVYGGWVYAHSEVSLDELYRKMKIPWNAALHVSSNIEFDKNIPQAPKLKGESTVAQTAVIALAGRTEEEIFQSFKHSQKNKIRKAVKNGVSVIQATPNEVGQFYELLAELKQSVNKDHSPQQYFQDLFGSYYARGRAACFIATHEDQNISTLIVLANRACATIWMGGRKMGIPNNLYQNELMIWEAIKWAGSFGSEYFDLCTVDELRYANLARMKLSFSRDIRLYYHYTFKGLPVKVLNRILKNVN